jgi:type I restriction enzyme S subunit
MTKLIKHIKIISGFAFKSSLFNSDGKGMPLIRIRDVGAEGISTYFDGSFSPEFIITKGDLLIAMDGQFRLAEWNSENALLNQRVCKITVDSNDLDKRYLYFVLPIELKRIEDSTSFVTVKHLSVKKIKDIEIPLPPLETQRKIAAILDAADQHRQKTKALIEKYNELAQSLFLEMFGDPVTNPKGWKEIKLGDICGVGSSKRVFVDDLVEDGIPFYRGTEIGKLGEGKTITPTLFITKEHYKKLKQQRGIPKIGDLLMPSICPDGRIWVVDSDKEFYFKDGRVLWVEVDSKKMNSIYLRYHLKGSFFANYNNIASGTTFAELKIVALKTMNVLYPEMMLQNQFAERIQAIEKQKTKSQTSLAKAEELFQSLLQKAFKGELS